MRTGMPSRLVRNPQCQVVIDKILEVMGRIGGEDHGTCRRERDGNAAKRAIRRLETGRREGCRGWEEEASEAATVSIKLRAPDGLADLFCSPPSRCTPLIHANLRPLLHYLRLAQNPKRRRKRKTERRTGRRSLDRRINLNLNASRR